MCFRSYSLAILLVVWVCFGSVLCASPPPENVYAFQAGDITLFWDDVDEEYQYYWDGSDDYYLDRSAGPDGWYFYSLWTAGVEQFSIPVVDGESPIRSSIWGEQGYYISNVRNEDWSEWIDPRTGQPFDYSNFSGTATASSSPVTPVFNFDWWSLIIAMWDKQTVPVKCGMGLMFAIWLLMQGKKETKLPRGHSSDWNDVNDERRQNDEKLQRRLFRDWKHGKKVKLGVWDDYASDMIENHTHRMQGKARRAIKKYMEGK